MRDFGRPPICYEARPIYAHFLNRELLRGFGLEVSDLPIKDILSILLLCTIEPLYSSLAFIWELSTYVDDIVPMIRRLHDGKFLTVISTFPTAEEFLASAQVIYAHDSLRYPMYFQHVPESLLSVRPDSLKRADTTTVIGLGLRGFAEGAVGHAWEALSPTDKKALEPLRSHINPLLDVRNGRAITLSLFQQDLEASGLTNRKLSLARLLSLLHLSHYLESIGADIPTGIGPLSYFDELSRAFPIVDLSLLSRVIRLLGISVSALGGLEEVDKLLAQRGSAEHRHFVESLRFLLNAAQYRVWKYHRPTSFMALRDLVALSLDEILLRTEFPRLTGSGLQYGFGRLALQLDKLGVLARRDRAVDEFWNYWIVEMKMSRKSVLILTATALETTTVMGELKRVVGFQSTPTFVGDHTIHVCGALGDCDVSVVQSEMGTEAPGAMMLTANDVIEALKPDSVVLLGIAFGLKPDKQAIGDVLVSKQLCLYDPRKLVEVDGVEKWLARGDRSQASTRLLDRFRSGSLGWTEFQVHFGLILSGNTLVNSPEFIQRLKEIESEAIGGEMEGAGVYSVGVKRKVDWIVVKGIADWGAKKTDEHQRLAACNASRFLVHVIHGGGLGV